MLIARQSIGWRLHGSVMAVVAVVAGLGHRCRGRQGAIGKELQPVSRRGGRARKSAQGGSHLWTVLGYYPTERLEVELGEGIGSRHREMPQIQFSAEEITSIYYYLHSDALDAEQHRP